MEHSTEILYNKTEVFCSAAHRFGSDALLLVRFTEPKRSQKAADLCSGCGIVSLEWHDRGHRSECAAVELQPEASNLLREALAAQGIDRGRVLAASRPTPHGLLSWQISVRDDGQRLFGGCLPTLIEWGAAHPCDHLPSSGVQLQALQLQHPDAAALQAACGAAGLAQVATITDGPAPRLQALLATPHGPLVLNSGA